MKTKQPILFPQLFLFLGIVYLGLCPGHTVLAASPPGDVVGKVSVGYQGWFACAGDGSPVNNWTHWSANSALSPASNNISVKAWPDMRECTTTYPTAFSNCPNGQPATLYSSYDQQTVDTHFRWMADNGIDTVALQRFGGGNTDAIAPKVRAAAEAYGRKFYLMYDFNGFNTPAALEADWLTKGKAFTSSPAYAMQNGKPVVCMWGVGMSYMTTAQNLEIINWLENSQGCYVIGGVQRGWRTDTTNVAVYLALNMISPWMIGYIGSVSDADGAYSSLWVPDQAYCNANGIDYQPCILPGDVSAGNQRVHGGLEWEMLYNATKLGCQGIYISMFDEYSEGNQIAETTETLATTPAASGFLALNQDGTTCSSDYYLRLTGDGDKMFKGITALTSVRPTVPLPPLVLPATPANLTALGGNARIVLNWGAVFGAADVSGYTVGRGATSNGPYVMIATNVGNVSYTDTNVLNNTTYYYVVSSVNSLGESTNSLSVAATPMVSYAVDSGGAAAGTFAADVYYSSGNTTSTGTTIDTSGVTNPATQVVYQTERWGPNTYTFPNLIPGASYLVRLHFAEIYFTAPGMRLFNVAINGTQVLANFDIFATAGTNNKAVIKQFKVAANGSGQIAVQYSNGSADNAKSSGIEILPVAATPQPPAGLAASAVSSSQISLSWTAASVGFNSASTYDVYRATAIGGPYTNIGTGDYDPAFWNTGLAAGTTYYYEISVVNDNGQSANSAPVSVTTQVLPVPAIPTDLNAISPSGQVILNWDGCAWATGYNVKYSTVNGGPYTVIATNVANVYYTNNNAANGATYYYVVSATNSAGESANSAPISVIPGLLSQAGWVPSASVSDPGSPVTNAVDGNLATRWSSGAYQTPGQWFELDLGSTNIFNTIVLNCGSSTGDYPRGYQVSVSNDGATWSSPVATGTGSAVTTITFSMQTARYLRITQTGSAGANWWSIAEINVFGTPGALPAAPVGVTAVPGGSQIALAWVSSLGATGYNVKRALSSGGPYTTIAASLPALTYTNTGLLIGTNYYYVVSATNSFGESANSLEVVAQPFSLALALTAPSTGGFTMTWATNVLANLYYTRSLAPAAWTPITNVPVVSNGRCTVTLSPATNGSGFYELR